MIEAFLGTVFATEAAYDSICIPTAPELGLDGIDRVKNEPRHQQYGGTFRTSLCLSDSRIEALIGG